MVNHHADIPKLKESCAVPTVDCPPTSVPMIVPATTHVPALPPPVLKSLAFFTFRTDIIPIVSIIVITKTIPKMCNKETDIIVIYSPP